MKVDFNGMLNTIGQGMLLTIGFLIMTFLVDKALPVLLAAAK